MTTQQFSFSIMIVIGVILFFAGRVIGKKFSVQKHSLSPSFILTTEGIIAYFSVVVSWAGILLAVVCGFLLVN